MSDKPVANVTQLSSGSKPGETTNFSHPGEEKKIFFNSLENPTNLNNLGKEINLTVNTNQDDQVNFILFSTKSC